MSGARLSKLAALASSAQNEDWVVADVLDVYWVCIGCVLGVYGMFWMCAFVFVDIKRFS